MSNIEDTDRVTKVEHVWSEEHDRWMYIEYNCRHRIIGLNFMQGDDYTAFDSQWSCRDKGLTQFYEKMVWNFPIEKASVDTKEFINKCMWAYFDANSANEEYS
jgi:hypothetical protein